jgi:hypothetical protein
VKEKPRHLDPAPDKSRLQPGLQSVYFFETQHRPGRSFRQSCKPFRQFRCGELQSDSIRGALTPLMIVVFHVAQALRRLFIAKNGRQIEENRRSVQALPDMETTL